jgi:hypothetical protein
MKNFKQMVYKNLYDAKANKPKPDFLDLDKDGNKEEPMKQAAEDAKKAEKAEDSEDSE